MKEKGGKMKKREANPEAEAEAEANPEAEDPTVILFTDTCLEPVASGLSQPPLQITHFCHPQGLLCPL